MKVQKLNYHFRNPNSQEETANFLLKVFLQTNNKKVENAIKGVQK